MSSKRVLLGLLVLGVFGMHALMVGCGTTTGHQVTSAASATSMTSATSAVVHAGTGPTAPHVDVPHPDAAHMDAAASPAPSPAAHGHDDAALVLCIALLLVLAAGSLGGRRTTWVSLLERARSHTPLPLPPVLRDATPVPRFTVMLC